MSVGKKIGKFVLEKELGRGSFGSVNKQFYVGFLL